MIESRAATVDEEAVCSTAPIDEGVIMAMDEKLEEGCWRAALAVRQNLRESHLDGDSAWPALTLDGGYMNSSGDACSTVRGSAPNRNKWAAYRQNCHPTCIGRRAPRHDHPAAT